MWILFLLGAATSYCPAGNKIAQDSNLGPVELIGVKQTAIVDKTDCPNTVGLVDLTSESATLEAGGSYTLYFQATTCGDAWNRLAYAYIDFNGNDAYDPNELLGQQQVGARLAPSDVSFTFVVPPEGNNTKVGKTRMRVFVVESGRKPDPCLSFSYGRVKEFSIEITPTSPYCPAGNTNVGDSNLGPVKLVGVTNAIDDRTDCPGGVGLIDLTSESASLKSGGSYTLYFQATTCGKGRARLAYAYIDFNGNNMYDDSELLGQQKVNSNVAPQLVSFQFVVPSEANGTKVGRTRMRVFVVEGGITTYSCATFASGGAKEFSIDIAPYCLAGNTYVGDSNLGPVELMGEGSTAIDDRTNCPGGKGVIDLTSESATLKLGGSYTLHFQATTCGSGFSRLTYAYIDFNGNGMYDDSELLGQQAVGSAKAPYDLSFSFVVPGLDKGTRIGKTRMRVFVVEGGRVSDPCAFFSYGGVKEFSISIVSAVPELQSATH